MFLFDQLKKTFKKKKILIVGLGLLGGGEGLVKFFVELGAKVRVTDKKKADLLRPTLDRLRGLPVEYSLGRHKLSDFLWSDIIFKGPSVPWDLPEICKAKRQGKIIDMELSFFASHCQAKIIGITGTRGKSTTTNLIYHILKNTGINVYLGGRLPNISTLKLLKKIQPSDYVVLELSSWDLSGFHKKRISPHIAVFTSFYPDHLNYYKNMNEYFYDKSAIYLYQHQSDFLVVNHSVKKYLESHFKEIKSKIFFYSDKDLPLKLKYLYGKHNYENGAAALQVAKILKIDLDRAKKLIVNFQGLSYRLEKIGKKDKILFINDSASTTPIAVIRAIQSLIDRKIFLILGGNSKNLPFDDLVKWLTKVEKIILITGSFTKEILPFLRKKYPNRITKIYSDLKTAVEVAFDYANQEKKGEKVILFSPGATSFAMFKNEFHRGEEFNKIVRKLINNQDSL